MELAIIARRLTILFLVFTVFALAFTAMVTRMPRNADRVHVGTAAPCFHPASPGCVVPSAG